MPEYQGTVSTKYLFIQDQANHFAYAMDCSGQTRRYCRTIHEQIIYVSTAFWMLHLKNDPQYGDNLRNYASAQPDATLLSEAAE